MGYDAAEITFAAIDKTIAEGILPPSDPNNTEQIITFRKAISKNIRSLNTKNGIVYEGTTGSYHFNDNGDITDKNGTKADGKVSIYRIDLVSNRWSNVVVCPQ